jgi:hypothetical protein
VVPQVAWEPNRHEALQEYLSSSALSVIGLALWYAMQKYQVFEVEVDEGGNAGREDSEVATAMCPIDRLLIE